MDILTRFWHNLCIFITNGDMMSEILILNGPNLNLLGAREPQVYGSTTLEQINANLSKIATFKLDFYQSQSESALIDRIHQAFYDKTRFIIFNPAAFTHTSIALRDALLAVNLPFIEVHLSNIYARETFRHHSYFSDIAQGTITGLGSAGYELALIAAEKYLTTHS